MRTLWLWLLTWLSGCYLAHRPPEEEGGSAGATSPRTQPSASRGEVLEVSAGVEHVCAVSVAGALYCWGSNEWGELGTESTNDSPVPVRVGDGNDWQTVSAGQNRTCGLRAGRLFCWGKDEWGALLGDGTKMFRILSPTQIESESDWQSLSLGYQHVCGLRAGRLYCWGENEFGALGTGEERNEFGPAQIGDDADWETVSASGWNTCGVRAGELYCWGDDYRGEIPGAEVDPAKPYVLSPLRIGTERDWQGVAVGADFSCGTRASRLFCWGHNTDGQLGLGNDRFAAAPMPVGKAHDWQLVSAGGNHACALRADRLYCWGSNMAGALGRQSPMSASSPLRVGKAAEWDSVSAGSDYSCGVRAGALYCWGKFPGHDTPAFEPTAITLE